MGDKKPTQNNDTR